MAILVLIALCGGLNLGFGAQLFGQEADIGEVLTDYRRVSSLANVTCRPAWLHSGRTNPAVSKATCAA